MSSLPVLIAFVVGAAMGIALAIVIAERMSDDIKSLKGEMRDYYAVSFKETLSDMGVEYEIQSDSDLAEDISNMHENLKSKIDEVHDSLFTDPLTNVGTVFACMERTRELADPIGDGGARTARISMSETAPISGCIRRKRKRS